MPQLTGQKEGFIRHSIVIQHSPNGHHQPDKTKEGLLVNAGPATLRYLLTPRPLAVS